MVMLVWILNPAIVIQKIRAVYCLHLILFTIVFIWVGTRLLISLPLSGNLSHLDFYSAYLPIFSIGNKYLNNFKKTSFVQGVYKGYSIKLLSSSIKKYYINTGNVVSHSFLFPFIMANIEVGELNNNLADFAYSVLMFSLVAFFCFINILLYGIGYYLAKETKYNDKNKYRFLNKIIQRYLTVTTISIAIESLLCFISLFCLIGLSIFILYSVTTISWNG